MIHHSFSNRYTTFQTNMNGPTSTRHNARARALCFHMPCRWNKRETTSSVGTFHNTSRTPTEKKQKTPSSARTAYYQAMNSYGAMFKATFEKYGMYTHPMQTSAARGKTKETNNGAIIGRSHQEVCGGTSATAKVRFRRQK